MDSILYEIEIIAKPYSPYRGASKWRNKRENCSSHSNLISSDGANVMVFRADLRVLDYYPISSLIKRVEIKRNPAYFHCISILWNLANPGSLKLISREVHEIIVTTLYKLHFQSIGNPGLVEVHSKADNSIDFPGKPGLTFPEFYDILFEITDNLARSALANEYCRVIQTAIKNLRGSALFCSLNLYNKRHLKETNKPCYLPWMVTLVRSATPSQTSKMLPEIFRKIKPQKECRKEKNNEAGVFKSDGFAEFRKRNGLNEILSLNDLRKKSKSPVRLVTPKLVKGGKNFESYELRGLKVSLSPMRGVMTD